MYIHLPQRLVHLTDQVTQWIYRLTGGRVGATQMGYPVLLLTATGRKTGRPRTHTLVYMVDGERLIVAASNNGADDHPAWYLNLRANPAAAVQYGRRNVLVRATTAEPGERAELWPRLIRHHPPYARHQARTAREIPVVILTPVEQQHTASGSTPAGS